MTTVDVEDLRGQVKDMYRAVADDPHQDFHFEMGRALALRLGYDAHDLDAIPSEAIDSFAGVGCPLIGAAISDGDHVVDLGSGSGMDVFVASRHAGGAGEVIGVDMTDRQLAKSRSLADRDGFTTVRFVEGLIESAPVDDGWADVVISNGVINLCADKAAVFREAARLLRPGGRLSLSDIVTEKPLTEAIVCDATLWAACIGGAMQTDDYQSAITAAGLDLVMVRDNPEYRFISDSAQGATATFGVKSISVVATKPER